MELRHSIRFIRYFVIFLIFSFFIIDFGFCLILASTVPDDRLLELLTEMAEECEPKASQVSSISNGLYLLYFFGEYLRSSLEDIHYCNRIPSTLEDVQ